MQSFHDFFISHGFNASADILNVDSSVLNDLGKTFYIISKCILPPRVKVNNVTIAWDEFLIMRKDIINRINVSIETLLPEKCHFCIDNLSYFWHKLYMHFGTNFFNYIFDSCELYIQKNENQFISLGDTYPKLGPCDSSNRKKLKTMENSDNELGYDKDLIIKRKRMMYKNILRNKSNCIILKQDILYEVSKQDVGCYIKYNIKYTKMIKNLKKLENSDLCISHVRSILRNCLKPKEPIVSKESVLFFLRKVLSRIICNRIFNKKKHFLKFLENISILIERNVGQCVTLGEIMKGVVQGMNLVLQNLCAKIVLWLIYEVVFRIINCCFYVTETNKSTELVYILLPRWIEAENKEMEKLINNGHLKKIDKVYDQENMFKNVIKYNRLATMRFVPKDHLNSFRPIIHQSIYQKNSKKLATICCTFLKQIAAKENKRINIETNIYKSWKNLNAKTNKNTKLYFIKTDIKDAFGSINHKILKKILRSIMSEIIVKNGRWLSLVKLEYKRFNNQIMQMDQLLAEGLPCTVPGKIIRRKSLSKDISVRRMRNYIFDFIDKFYLTLINSKVIYQNLVGVPQGLKLSAALCEIYYHHFDCKYLEKILVPEEGDIFLRSVDDYLFVSKCKNRVLRFYRKLTTHCSKYNFEIKQEKTLSNALDPSIEMIVPYFGFSMDLKHKTIAPDLSIYAGKTVSSTMSCSKLLSLDELTSRVFNSSAIKLIPMLLDQKLMPKRATINNLFKISCLFTLRFITMFDVHKKRGSVKPLFDLLRRAVSSIASKTSPRNMLLPGRIYLNRQAPLKYVIYRTFLKILLMIDKNSALKSMIFRMIHHLKSYMTKTELRRLKKMTGRLPSELEHSVMALKNNRNLFGVSKGNLIK